jgi:NitT/TauT family transport system substrate-binding protein
MITLSENFRALFYAPFYAAHAIGAYAAEGVEVALRDSPDPSATAADLREGRIDVMWGGPLRVLLTHAADPDADIVCFCDVVARDPFFVVGREPRPDFRPADLLGVRFASVAEVPTPWLCLQDDLRRDGVDPAALNRISGPSMAENAAALREGRLDAVQLFQPYAEDLLASGTVHLWSAAATRG